MFENIRINDKRSVKIPELAQLVEDCLSILPKTFLCEKISWNTVQVHWGYAIVNWKAVEINDQWFKLTNNWYSYVYFDLDDLEVKLTQWELPERCYPIAQIGYASWEISTINHFRSLWITWEKWDIWPQWIQWVQWIQWIQWDRWPKWIQWEKWDQWIQWDKWEPWMPWVFIDHNERYYEWNIVKSQVKLDVYCSRWRIHKLSTDYSWLLNIEVKDVVPWDYLLFIKNENKADLFVNFIWSHLSKDFVPNLSTWRHLFNIFCDDKESYISYSGKYF